MQCGQARPLMINHVERAVAGTDALLAPDWNALDPYPFSKLNAARQAAHAIKPRSDPRHRQIK